MTRRRPKKRQPRKRRPRRRQKSPSFRSSKSKNCAWSEKKGRLSRKLPMKESRSSVIRRRRKSRSVNRTKLMRKPRLRLSKPRKRRLIPSSRKLRKRQKRVRKLNKRLILRLRFRMLARKISQINQTNRKSELWTIDFIVHLI